jgi:hypothetical protein
MKQDPSLTLLLQRIEQQVNRTMKTPKDFEYLSECISATLHQHISATTLKRLWGYLSEPVTPRLSTLNLLAQFVGAESWEAFQQTLPSSSQEEGNGIPANEQGDILSPIEGTEKGVKQGKFSLPIIVGVGGGILIVLLLFFFFFHTQSPTPSHSQTDPITFADSAVKALCVEHWDSNGDGELSYEEAAQVQDLKDVFREDTTITTFDELQYFTGLTYIGEKAFTQCSNLTSIILPSQVKSIYTHAFSQCTRLIAITIPDGVTSIGYSAFYLCNSLTSLAIPSSVTSINEWNSFAMANLKYITVDENNTVYDSRNNCNAIIETATNKLVSGCSTTVIPKDVTTIGTSAFYSCYSLESMDIPANITKIGTTAFAWSMGLKSVTCHWDKPISFGKEAFDHIHKTCTLTVPPGTRDAYIAAGWTEEIFKGGVIEASE